MPVTNEYHIYIHGSGGGEKSPVAKEEKEEKWGKIISFGQIKHAADKYISHEISQVEVKTGASEYAQRLQVLHSVGSQAVSSSLMIAAAFKVSSPVGIVTLLLQAVDKAASLLYEIDSLNNRKSLEDNTIRLANIRAGTGRPRNG